MAEQSPSEKIARTPLFEAHVSAGARMVPFAGYEMPVQYPTGIMTEHKWTRENAGLFDVSHMGQAFLIGPDHATTAAALESMCAADFLNLKPGMQRYSQLLAEDGGILDDLMVTRPSDPAEDGVLMLVVNAACKEQDFPHIAARLPENVRLLRADHRALVAIQGPKAIAALSRHAPGVEYLPFMGALTTTFAGKPCHVSRSGYTGEDGFEISINARYVGGVWHILLSEPEVKPIGLGARDSLRLEAGLCLYGHDIDITTSPVEGALVWSMQKRRRETGGFPGFERIQRELKEGPWRVRVGILPEGRLPAREGSEIHAGGRKVGVITSGGFGPTLNAPVAMGYVEAAFSGLGTELTLMVRDKAIPAKVAAMPFVPNGYVRKK